MSDATPTAAGNRSPSLGARVEEMCDRFEAAWKAGLRPRIEEYLGEVPEPGRAALLRALVELELAYRRQNGERPTPEEYECRFPEHVAVIETALGTAPPPLMNQDKDTHEAVPPTLFPSEPAPFPFGDPTQIGRFKVIRLLGTGSFGRVYLAHDDELDRAVAIKVPNPERVSSALDLEVYLREAKVLAQLEHPHIVPVYDVGRTEDGLCYVVSRFLEGSDLAAKIQQDRPGIRESVGLVATVADALHYAHTRGLVHRDIKPANILIDAAGKPCIADFGLALKDEDFGKGAGLAGTPAYMSPEQARGEGHRVDGRSDIFSLGVVLYELLTGRRPFKGDSVGEVLEQIKHADVRPPRQIDDTIPKELERICLKTLAKRATERYTTARDMADDLLVFLRSPEIRDARFARASTLRTSQLGSTHEVARALTTEGGAGTFEGPVKIVPKGLRSFDEQDADFFLELLPGPRDRDGLPESIRFWKGRIESTDPDKTFRVGLIYGPSGCGKSSMVKAGILPRLRKHVLPVYIEATQDQTETRILKGLQKVCPGLTAGPGLVDSLAAVRKGRLLPSGQKLLLVLDQFEQWLHSKRSEENTELLAALRQCDGEHAQAIVMVRDDFWMAATRFMDALEVELLKGQNTAAVDLFDPRHARKVLLAFGVAYGNLSERTGEISKDPDAFLDQAITELAQDGKVISVRLALFAEMVKGKPWTPATLRAVGGTEGVGVTFLEETFSSPQANPKHRVHQKAAQAVLKALLPETGTDIKGQMRSEQELREAAAYSDRPRDFGDLMHILDGELHLITPADPEGSRSEGRPTTPSGRYFQLTHDYLVHSLRNWLTRKQRETRRGRAELRLVERSTLWNAKPENRHLPSVWEWASIRALSRPRDWTDQQRRMMRRAGRMHGARGVLTFALLSALVLAAIAIRRQVIDNQRATLAYGLVQRVLDADTPQVPDIVGAMREYRQWVNSSLRTELDKSSDDSREKLHASLALLPVDASQVDYLFARLIKATPSELPVLRDALKTHRSTLTPKLWTVLEPAKPGDGGLLPTASALASYAPDDPRWEGLAGKVSQALVSVNPVFLGSWLDALRPVRSKLTSPLATLFQERSVPETEQTLVTNILADYARDDPDRLAELLMVADPKAYVSLFPIVEKRAEQILPVFQAELAREATYSWNDPPLDPSWTEPSADLKGRIESAHGMVEKRFAFCQTMPLDRFVTTAKALDNSGYRPVRFRPFADGQDVKVAAVWTRDGCKWRMASGLTAEQVRTQDDELGQGSPDPAQTAGRVGRGSPGTRRVAAHDADRRSPALGESADSGRPSVPGRAGSGDPRPTLAGDLAMTKYVPVDVAGYEATDPQGKAAIHYAALWVEQTRPDDDAQMYVAATANEEKEAWKRLGGAKLVPRTQHALLGSDGKTRYCGVWGRPPRAGETARLPRHQSERNLEQSLATRSDQLLVDLAVSSAPPPTSTRVRAQASLAAAERILSAKPDDPIARYTRAMAYFHLGEDLKALVDLGLLIEKAPQFADVRHARVYRAIIHARLGQKKEAQEDLAFFQKGSTPESSKLYLAVVVASELGAGQSAAFERLEVALKRQPGDSGLAYDAACAYALASRALAKTDRASSERHAGRAIRLLEAAIKSGYSDYDHIQEDSDLDPIRDLPAFVDLIKESHPDRLYSEVWSADIRFDSKQSHGLDPAAQLRRCHELIAQGYRPVSLSTARTLPDGPLVTASVWHRPSVSEQARDDLAERQARAAAALVRLGRPAQVWPLLVHSPDPRLRSFIVNGLRPRGANPEVIAAEFDRLVKVGRGNDVGRGSPDPSQEPDRVGRGSPDPAQGADRRSPAPGASADSGTPSVPERAATLPVPGDARPTLSGDPRSRAARATNVMDAILFHPETSTLRALILTLGTYGAEWLSPGERDPLTAKLLDLYENDPDAGIHGAAEWTLRQWKQEERLKSAQAELSKLKDRGHRRWLINSQGQTFAVIDGPVQFRIGSPRGELDRDADELPHPRVIPRRFAIADKEVTVEQYDRFARAKPQFGLARSYLDKHSPEANGPMIGVSWFGAVAYCNWLSEQEGLPTDQWCYLPNDRRDYDAGMTIPADSFKRKGYRLPAEAEWEYACRAGTVTSRYYGLSKSLLEAYARYAANSNEHAWAGGRLLPNDLGLFDMLGNVYEWCQERNATYQPGGVESIHDEIINLRVPRLIRGGAFDYSPASVRSALRTGLLPWSQTSDSGFRLARTYQ